MASQRVASRPLWLLVFLLPMAGLAVLLGAPRFDVMWMNHPAHFWIVLGAGGLSAALAYAMGAAACRRKDARVLLVSLAFLVAAGFLSLHALSTPGMLVETPNEGFAIATPVGLLIAAVPVALSSMELSGQRQLWVIARARLWRGLVLAVMAGWAALALTRTWPLDGPPAARAESQLVGLAVPAVGLYAIAVARYIAHPRFWGSTIVRSAVASFILLAEAMVAVAVARNWHTTWWEWHVLMLGGFAAFALGAHREWHEERFSELSAGGRDVAPSEVTVVFADLAGFTRYSEAHTPGEVTAMLNHYFDAAIPLIVRGYGGEVDRIIGDALMVTFNRHGDQGDHPRRAVQAALALQATTQRIADEHPDWPRFRVGINTGQVAVSVVGAAGGRTSTAIGDAVNTAARIEAMAPVGGVAVGAATARRLPDSWLDASADVTVKGKDDPVTIFTVRTALPTERHVKSSPNEQAPGA